MQTALAIVGAFAGGGAAGWGLRAWRGGAASRQLRGRASAGRPSRAFARDPHPNGKRRILLPFTGSSISRRSLEAAVRLARAEDATIMPTFLARVPRHLPLDAPLPQQCMRFLPLLEAIEQRVLAAGVAVDARVSRGRTYRDALRHQLDAEPVDRIIVSATTDARTGLNGEDLQWLLEKVPAEVLIVRADFSDRSTIGAEVVHGGGLRRVAAVLR